MAKVRELWFCWRWCVVRGVFTPELQIKGNANGLQATAIAKFCWIYFGHQQWERKLNTQVGVSTALLGTLRVMQLVPAPPLPLLPQTEVCRHCCWGYSWQRAFMLPADSPSAAGRRWHPGPACGGTRSSAGDGVCRTDGEFVGTGARFWNTDAEHLENIPLFLWCKSVGDLRTSADVLLVQQR